MAYQFVVWLSFIACLVLVFFGFRAYLDFRKAANALSVVALNEFFEAAQKMMKTPEEVPDTILLHLDVMRQNINHPRAPRVLLTSLKTANRANGPDVSDRDNRAFLDEVKSMRPELQELFSEAALSFFRFVSLRRTYYQFAIMLEMWKRSARKNSITLEDGTSSLSLIARLSSSSESKRDNGLGPLDPSAC